MHGGHETAKVRGIRRAGGGRGLRGGGRKNNGWGVSWTIPEFSVSPPTSGRVKWHKTVEQGAERFMAKWVTAEKPRAKFRHAEVYPEETGRTKERIAQ